MSFFVRRFLLLPLLVVLALPVVAWLGLPWPWVLRWVDPPDTAFMLYREREAERAGEAYEPVQDRVALEDLPETLVRAVLVAEDHRFRAHGGVDWRALAEEVQWAGDTTFSWRSEEDRAALRQAIAFYRANRDEVKGRSTLTQQLAKNLYFTPDRSLVRKAGEFFVARRLELFLGKDRILELYLNTVELGPGVFGVGAAARRYFGVPAQRLDRAQAASLAATLPHPLTSNPEHRPGRMAWRRDLILARLAGRDVGIPDDPPPVDLPAPDPVALDTMPPLDPVLPDTLPARDTLAPDTLPGRDVLPADTVAFDLLPPDAFR